MSYSLQPFVSGTRTRSAHRASRDLTSPDTRPSERRRANKCKARQNKDGNALFVCSKLYLLLLAANACRCLRSGLQRNIEARRAAGTKYHPSPRMWTFCFVDVLEGSFSKSRFRRVGAKDVNDHEREGARTSGVTNLIVVVCNGASRLPRRWSKQRAKSQMVPQGANYSAGATTRVRSFSAPLTSTAITAVANTKPSAMAAVTPSSRPKPPRPCRKAMIDTAAPDTTKVRK